MLLEKYSNWVWGKFSRRSKSCNINMLVTWSVTNVFTGVGGDETFVAILKIFSYFMLSHEIWANNFPNHTKIIQMPSILQGLTEKHLGDVSPLDK